MCPCAVESFVFCHAGFVTVSPTWGREKWRNREERSGGKRKERKR